MIVEEIFEKKHPKQCISNTANDNVRHRKEILTRRHSLNYKTNNQTIIVNSYRYLINIIRIIVNKIPVSVKQISALGNTHIRAKKYVTACSRIRMMQRRSELWS